MNDVVRNTDKLGVPVGAGVYKASNANGDDANITSSGFMSNGAYVRLFEFIAFKRRNA